MKKLTHREFLLKAMVVHGDKYSYLEQYFDSKTKIKIKCNVCDFVFYQTPNGHLRGHGCHKCSGTYSRNKNDFVNDAVKIHGNKYEYFGDDFRAIHRIKIYCKNCNVFFYQRAADHLNGHGCSNCYKTSRDDFVKKAKMIHGNKYSYDKSFTNIKTKIKIKCNMCGGFFYQIPYEHLRGRGCPRCNRILNRRLSNNDFIDRAKRRHGDKYSYISSYVDTDTKISIKCNICNNVFQQLPHNHLSGKGCPVCRESRGERKIARILNENDVRYERQKKFKDCINPITGCQLSYDFYIPLKKILVEYDGIYHFEDVNIGRNGSKCRDVRFRDNIKNEYANKKGMRLVRIPYWEIDKLREILLLELDNAANQ